MNQKLKGEKGCNAVGVGLSEEGPINEKSPASGGF